MLNVVSCRAMLKSFLLFPLCTSAAALKKSKVQHFVCVKNDGRHEEKQDSAVSLIKPLYGRTGNRIISVEHMILYALAHSCDILLPEDIIGDFLPGCIFFSNTRRASLSRNASCKAKSGREWYELKIQYSEISMKIARKVVSEYLQTNVTHAYGRPCEAKPQISFHIRSGDTLRGGYNEKGAFIPGSVHLKYAPVPTSFYAEVLKDHIEQFSFIPALQRTSSITVVTQDMKNPTTEFFLKLQNIGYNITFRIGSSLLGDLHVLTCSSNAAISYGSFWNAFALRNSTQLHIFTKYCRHKEHVYSQGASFYTFLSRSTGREYIKGTKIWKNTAYQRYLVDKYYPITKCSL